MSENTKKNNLLLLYLKCWGIFCLIYSYMLFQFWWGNHDWKPLIYGIDWNDGLFEARYSQHLFTVFFFNGQILPTLYVIISLGLLALLCLFSAKYLCLRQNQRTYFLFILLLGCSPYTFVLFHYVFITAPMIMWGSVLIGLLMLSEGSHKFWKICVSSLGFAFTLGGYPPNISFAAIMFCGRKIILYQNKKQNITQILGDSIFLGLALLIGYGINRLIVHFLTVYMGFRFQMYNMRTSSLMDIIQKIPQEILRAFQSLGDVYSDLGAFYAVFISIICFGAILWILQTVPNKLIGLVMILCLMLATRIAYLISANAWYAGFRIGYWSFLGLSAVALSILFNINNRAIKNIMFALSVVAIFVFAKSDYEIEKTVFYKFRIERLFQKRVGERISLQPQFKIKANYAALAFSYPDFKTQVCPKGCPNLNNEILDDTVLPADLGYVLFWDEVENPISIKFGIWGKTFWRVNDPVLKNTKITPNADNIQNISYWVYIESKPYPFEKSIYVDDKYILMNFDELFFNQNRGLLLYELKGSK